MDVNNVFKKLIELGHDNSQRDVLQEFCKLKIDLIIKYLPRRILNNDSGDLLDCIFSGIVEASNRNKVKIVDVVLQTMRKESTSMTHCSNVISRICLELPRLPANDLVRWCNDSIQSIVDDSDVNMIWRDILPESASALSSQDTIKHCGTDLSYSEYKEQCVHTLCHCRWSERQLVQLTAMFKDMQLNKSDHKQVVNKICSYITDIPPETIPPLVHQLIKICKTNNMDIVLTHLSHYFNIRLYSKLEPPPHDSESTTMDMDDIVQHSPAELSRCLSTCLYHMSQGAADPELIRRHIKAWPRTQLLRSPYIIDLALAISDKGPDFRSVCLDVIRLAIEQRVRDEQRRLESCWVRSVLPPDVDVVCLLKVLITESANHRQLTVVGLINLAFSLLSVPKTKPTAPTCWSHGKLILVRLCKSQAETAGHILGLLSDKLAGDCSQRQFAECLHVLCKLTPHSVERCTQLSTILESCQPTGTEYRPAAAVLEAVSPLLNFSTRVRDTLVLVCRKGMYSRESVQRCVALSGFLSVLRHVRVSRGEGSAGGVGSQGASSDQYSAHSYLTQLTIDLHATHNGQVTSRVRNETMCMEVVSIIRRCLQQDAAVKQLLYSKLYECAKEKEVLREPILEMLYEHLIKYLTDSENTETPLLLDKCVHITALTATLTEPMSHLLYAIAQFLQPSEDEDLEDILSSQNENSGTEHLKTKLLNILHMLCTNDRFGHIDMDDPGLTDLTPESKAKCLKVQQILLCYESLIAHKVMQCTPSSSDVANSVWKLYKMTTQLLDNTKTSPKQAKKASKTINQTGETVKSQKSQKTQKEKGKGPIKLTNLVKDRAGPFKSLPCLWNVKFCLRIIELLYSEFVTWCPQEQRNQLRSRREFHRWTMRSVHSVLTTGYIEKRDVASSVVKVAAVLYTRCICRFQDICEFDDQTALNCVEVFKDCITLILSTLYSFKIDVLLSGITGESDVSNSSNIAIILEKIHVALQRIEEDSNTDERDPTMPKLTTSLAQVASLLLEIPVQSCDNLISAIVKLEEFVKKSQQPESLSLIPALLTAGYRDQQEAQFLEAVLLKLTAALGKIDEEDTSAVEDVTNFPSVDSSNGHTILSNVCTHLTQRAKCVEQLLARAKDLALAADVVTHDNIQRIDKELKEVYQSSMIQLCHLATWTTSAVKLRCSIGADSERVLTACVRLYSLLAALVKQLQHDCVTLASTRLFERLLKLSGKKLSMATDNLITYLEASQEKQTASRVLRDTKQIPRLVLEAEQFSKFVILLADKTKLNLQQYLSLGTARDFRIRAPVLQQVLQEQRAENEPQQDDEENINDAETEILTQSDNEENENQRTKTKKRRVK